MFSLAIAFCLFLVASGNSQYPFGVCYHGQLSQVTCNKQGQCAAGQSCINGLCCTITGKEYTAACGGVAATGSCSGGRCSDPTQTCTASNYCCECAVGRASGKCISGACPAGFSCNAGGFCCPSCPSGAMPFGACQNGGCGGGRSCRAGNICC